MTQKVAGLLGYLALHVGQSHPREVLIEMFWPGQVPEAGRRSLRVALTSLRKQLEPPEVSVPASGGVLQATRHTVGLNAAAVTTDVAEFERLLGDAARMEDSTTRAGLLARAVALYRGEVLPGFYHDWVMSERSRREEQHAEALQTLAQLAERGGDRATALRWARQAAEANPYVENNHRRVIRLLAALGRPDEASRAYQALETLLQQEFGASPEPVTRKLLETIHLKNLPAPDDAAGSRRAVTAGSQQRTSPVSPASGRDDQTPQAAPVPLPIRLPLQLTRLYGRDEELALLGALLTSGAVPGPFRLVTLTGPGGSGKTRLAIEAARRVAEGGQTAVFFVSLAEVAEPRLIVSTIAAVFPLEPQQSRAADPLEQMVTYLGRYSVLLVLDNVEHVLGTGEVNAAQASQAEVSPADVVALVVALLERVPSLTCLCTSRRRLDVEGEREMLVGPLPFPSESDIATATPERVLIFPSVQLYLEHAQAARPDFQVTSQNAVAIAELCALLEGLPLSLVLAAARVRQLPPRRMREQLAGRLNLPESRYRNTPPRHRSLRALLGWSYALLPAAVQRLFGRLSVFSGGWTEMAAKVIGADESSESGNTKGVDEAISELISSSLVTVEGNDEDNVTGQMRYRMLETIREYAWEQLSARGEKARVSRRHLDYFSALAFEAEPHVEGPEQARWLACLEREHDNLRAALAWSLEKDPVTGLRLATALWRFWELRDHWAEGLDWLERALRASENDSEDVPKITEAVAEARGRALNAAGALAVRLGRYPLALPYMQEAVMLWRRLGREDKLATGLSNLGVLAYEQGDYERARACYEEGRIIQEGLGDQHGLSKTLNNLAIMAWSQGDLAQARTLYEQSLTIKRDTGDVADLASTLNNLGTVAKEEGDYKAARANLSECRALLEGVGNGWMAAYVGCNLADLARLEGDFAAAFALYDASLTRLVEVKDTRAAVVCLEGFAQLAAAQQQWEQAAWLLGAGRGLRVSLAHSRTSVQEDEYRPMLEETRARLGDEAFGSAVQAGEAATPDEAVRRARAGRAG